MNKFLLLIPLVLLIAAPAFSADVTGTWTASFDTQVGVQNYTYTFKVEEGKVSGDEITFVENLNFQDMPQRIEYKGKISGDEIKFTRKVADVATEELVAKRAK